MTEADEASHLRRQLGDALQRIRALEDERRPVSRTMTREDLAEQMFNAYNGAGPAASQWKTFDGRDVPRWRELSDQVRAKWMAAAEAARTFILSDTNELELVTHEGVIIHGLLSGVALCGAGVPQSWPAGHAWVAADAPPQGMNCEGCLREQANRGGR